MEIFFRKMIERVSSPVDFDKYNTEFKNEWDVEAYNWERNEEGRYMKEYTGPEPDKF